MFSKLASIVLQLLLKTRGFFPDTNRRMSITGVSRLLQIRFSPGI